MSLAAKDLGAFVEENTWLINYRTVDVGTPITYQGTDYLQVDLRSRLIYNVTSSSDLLNYYIQLGDDVIAAMT
jgi:hypothetical protein